MTPSSSRFGSDAKGNVAIIFALAMFPIIGVAAMAIDYTLAGRREAQLNAIADAAALMTTSPAGMTLAAPAAQASAVSMFNAQTSLIGGVSGVTPTVQVQDTTATNGGITRTAQVQYAGASQNAFSKLLNMNSINVSGISKVSRLTAPNIDFYLLLDTSPSMGIPSTQSGIDTMVAHTQQQGGCAFACHETNPTPDDVAGNPPGMDNYALARSLNLPLRIDLVQQATANLIQTAANTELVNKASYRVATYTFDATLQTITNLTSNLAQAQSDALNKIQMLQLYSNDQLTGNSNNNDEDTQFDLAMAHTSQIPNPGNGTNVTNDKPQEVLFIVTDGVIDEAYPNVGSTDMTYLGGRTLTTVGHQYDYCTPLKARGVRIAVLYTTYQPLPSNNFYNVFIAGFQPSIPTALTNCASPGLFFRVDTGGDIGAAMQALFLEAVGNAHLTQ